MSDPTEHTPAKRPEDKPDKAGNARVAVAAGIGGLAAVFAFVNLDKVEVNWVIGSWQTPLILVIVLSMLIGAGLDRLIVRRARKRKRERVRS